jgi:antitoxin component YwqK of YwqJK toxin-antitoxin module
VFIPCKREGKYYVLVGEVNQEKTNTHVVDKQKAVYYADSITIKQALDLFEKRVSYNIFESAFDNNQTILSKSLAEDRTEYLVGGTNKKENQKYFITFLTALEYLMFNFITIYSGVKPSGVFGYPLKQVEVRSYYENGSIHTISQRKNGKLHGVQEEYDLAGRKIKSHSYCENKKNGNCYDSQYKDALLSKDNKGDKVLLFENNTFYRNDKKEGKAFKYSCKFDKDNLNLPVKTYEEDTYSNDELKEKLLYEENSKKEWSHIKYMKNIEIKRTIYVCKENITANEENRIDFNKTHKNSYVLSKITSGVEKTFFTH